MWRQHEASSRKVWVICNLYKQISVYGYRIWRWGTVALEAVWILVNHVWAGSGCCSLCGEQKRQNWMVGWVWTWCEPGAMAFTVIRSQPNWTPMWNFRPTCSTLLSMAIKNSVCLSSIVPETCRMDRMAHWRCTGGSWWPNTLDTPLFFYFNLSYLSVSLYRDFQQRCVSLIKFPYQVARQAAEKVLTYPFSRYIHWVHWKPRHIIFQDWLFTTNNSITTETTWMQLTD